MFTILLHANSFQDLYSASTWKLLKSTCFVSNVGLWWRIFHVRFIVNYNLTPKNKPRIPPCLLYRTHIKWWPLRLHMVWPRWFYIKFLNLGFSLYITRLRYLYREQPRLGVRHSIEWLDIRIECDLSCERRKLCIKLLSKPWKIYKRHGKEIFPVATDWLDHLGQPPSISGYYILFCV